MGKLQQKWKDITINEYNVAKRNNKLSESHTQMVLAILDSSKCFSLESCGYVSLYVAKKYNLIYA
mgnify:FL=1